eukprot:g2282.t1
MPIRERRIQWERARNPELVRLQEQEGELQQRKQQAPVEQHHTPLDPGHFAVAGAADESRLPLAVVPALASTKTAKRVQFQHEEAPRQSENSEIDIDAEFAQIDDDPNLDWFEKDEKKANILKARELRERTFSGNADAGAGGFGGAGEVDQDEAEDMERISGIADRQLSELSHTEILGYLSEIHSTFTPEQIQCLKQRGAGKKVDGGLRHSDNRNVKSNSNGMNNRGGSTTASQKQKRSLFRAAVEENKLKHKKWGREMRESMNQQSGGQGNQQSTSTQAQAEASDSDSSSDDDESLPDLQEESDRKNDALMKLHLSPYELRKLEWTEPVLLPEEQGEQEEEEDPVERAFRRAAGGVATNRNGTTPIDPSDNPLVLDSLRFDLGGRLLAKNHRELGSPTLYHHGQEPERAGYTFKELFYLAQSHHKAQKTLALTTLQAILGKIWLTDGFGYCGGAGLFFDQLRGVVDLVLPHLADSDANVRWAALGVLEEMVCGGWDRTGKTEEQQEEEDQEEDQEEHESETPSRMKGKKYRKTFYADPRYSTFLEVCEEVFELPAIPGSAVFHSVGENKNGGVFDSLLERQKYVSSHVVRQSKKGSLLESTSGEVWSGDQQKPRPKRQRTSTPYLDAVKILVCLRDMALRVMVGKNVNDRWNKTSSIPEQLLVLKIATGLMPHLMVDDTLVNAALGPIGRDGEPLEEAPAGAEQNIDEKPQSTSLQMLAHVASLSRVYGWVEQAGFGRGGGGRAASSDVEIEESAQLRAAVLRLVRVSSQVGGGLVSKFWLELYPDGEVQAAARAAVASGFLASRPSSKSSLLAGIEGLRLWTLWVRQNLGTTEEPMGRGGFGYVDEDLSVFLPQLCAQMISLSADPLFSPEEQLLRTAARALFFRFCKELVVRVKSNTYTNTKHVHDLKDRGTIFMLAPPEVVLEGVLLRDGKFHAGFFETMFMSTETGILCGGSSFLEDEQRDLDAAFFLTKLRNACFRDEKEQTEQTTANGNENKYFRLSNVIRGEDMPMLHFPLWSGEVGRTVQEQLHAAGAWTPAGRADGNDELTVAECSERWGRLLVFSQEQAHDPWQWLLRAAHLLPAHYLPQLFLTQQGKLLRGGAGIKFHHLSLDEVRCRPQKSSTSSAGSTGSHEIAYEILARCEDASTARDLLHALVAAEETITKETAGTFESTQKSKQPFQLVCLLMCLCRHFAAGTDENKPVEKKDSKQRMTAPSLHDLLLQALRKLLLVSDVGEDEGSSSCYSEDTCEDLPQHEIFPLLVDDLCALYLAYGDFLPAVGFVLGWVKNKASRALCRTGVFFFDG